VTFQVQVFWIVLHAEDGGIMDLWSLGVLPQHYTASQRRGPWLEKFYGQFNFSVLFLL